MLFNSYEFLLAYFPLTLIVCFIITRQFGRERAIVWLVLASLFYYGWWEPSYVGLILASIAVNFATGRRIGT
jgi:D-alanyl-lipoteichoic acid acyltransferase DltB (MBOAT superfamily)